MDPVFKNKLLIFPWVWLVDQSSAARYQYALLIALYMTYNIVLSPSVSRNSKLPNFGKLLRYMPGATSAKLAGGPGVGDEGSLSSTLPSAEYAEMTEQLGHTHRLI